MDGLLSGYRAIEIGGPAGMCCGKLLGDLGMDVLRVEPPGGHPYRLEPPLVPWDGARVSAAWLSYNTSKRSALLVIETPEGRALLDRLLDRVELVIVDGTAAWMEEHGLAPRMLRAGRERLVAVAITPFGLEGPYRDYKTSDLIAQSAGGFVYLAGEF